MCGRFSASMTTADLASFFGIRAEDVRTGPMSPSWNVAPTDTVHVVLERHPRDELGVRDPSVVRRQLRACRWGLIPSWAKDRSMGARLINARAESVATKPAFRKALVARRCLLPADGYYEWLPQSDGRKQPFFIRRRDDVPVVLAGLYEMWRDPVGPADANLLWSCTVVTTEASPAVREIHDRMPVLLPPDAWDRWLDPAYADVDALCALLVPAPAESIEAWPVSPAVSSVRNQGPQLIAPVAVDETLF